MNMNHFPHLFLSILVFATLAGCQDNSSNMDVPNATLESDIRRGPATLIVEAVPQVETQRTMDDVELKPVEPGRSSLKGDAPPFEIFLAGAVALQGDSLAYILDRGDFRVKVLRLGGEFPEMVRTFGAGRGQGPAEFVNPVDIAISSDGNVHVLDMGNRKISTFTGDGQHLDDRNTPFAQQVVATTNNRLYLMHLRQESLLSEVTAASATGHSFGKLIEHQIERSMSLHGFVEATNELLIYVNAYTGDIASYHPDGTLAYYRKGIDRVKIPGFTSAVRDGSPGFSLDRPKPSKDYGPLFSVSDDFLMYWVSDAGKPTGIVDIYDTGTGDYRISLELSKQCGPLAVTDNLLLASCMGEFAIFRYDKMPIYE
jgi:hypothetical protein